MPDQLDRSITACLRRELAAVQMDATRRVDHASSVYRDTITGLREKAADLTVDLAVARKLIGELLDAVTGGYDPRRPLESQVRDAIEHLADYGGPENG